MTRSFDRRTLLTWSAGTIALAAAGGMVRAIGKGAALADDEAYSAWQLWNAPALQGTPLALVAAAVLAANPHYLQPWLFHVSDSVIEIHAALSRNLGAMDAFLREMHLGIGCAIQNAIVAAGPNGYAVEVDAMPGALTTITDRRSSLHAATLQLTRLAAPSAPDALYRAIPNRHTNRYAYDRTKPLPTAWREFTPRANIDDDVRIFLFEEGPQRTAFDAAVVEATQAIIADPQMIADSDRWFRSSLSEIKKHRDGPTLETAGLSPLTLLLAETLPLPVSMTHRAWLAQTRDRQVSSAALTGLIAVRDRYDRPMTIAAGRTWQRLHLYAAANGVAMQPLNQPIEMIDRERQQGKPAAWDRRVAALTGSADWQATFSFRAGIAENAAQPSARRALKDMLIG